MGSRVAMRAVALSFAMVPTAFLPALLGCGTGKFFVPTCQKTNSCGGGSTSYSSFAYVANRTIGTLELFPIPKKTFSSLTGQSNDLGTPPVALAATPKGTFLYVATQLGPIFVYTIGSDGALTLGNNSRQVASTLNPISMAVDPSGQWFFLVSSSLTALFKYKIDPSTGVLTKIGQGTPLDKGGPTQVTVTPNDQAVYVGIGTGGIDGFAFDSATGVLSNQQHYLPRGGAGSSDNALAAGNNSAFLFAGETGSGIRVFSIGAGGVLTEISGSPFQTELGPKSIVVDPTNRYVYVANSTANVITGYSLAASGALTPLSSSPFPTGTAPVAMSLDSTGAYLMVVCKGGSPDLQVFSFDAATPGKLDSVTTTPTGADPAGANAIAVVPAQGS